MRGKIAWFCAAMMFGGGAVAAIGCSDGGAVMQPPLQYTGGVTESIDSTMYGGGLFVAQAVTTAVAFSKT